MRWLVCVVLAAGCAGSARHTVAPRASVTPIAIDSIEVSKPRAGQLEASRLWERNAVDRAVTRDDDAALAAALTSDLERRLPVADDAPVHVRATLVLQDIGYYEGLAAETTDVTLVADVIDCNGNVARTITLREPASAPLQRSASRRLRLEAAVDRLAARLAAQL